MKLTPCQKNLFDNMEAARVLCGMIQREVKKEPIAANLGRLARAVTAYVRAAKEFDAACS